MCPLENYAMQKSNAMANYYGDIIYYAFNLIEFQLFRGSMCQLMEKRFISNN